MQKYWHLSCKCRPSETSPPPKKDERKRTKIENKTLILFSIDFDEVANDFETVDNL